MSGTGDSPCSSHRCRVHPDGTATQAHWGRSLPTGTARTLPGEGGSVTCSPPPGCQRGSCQEWDGGEARAPSLHAGASACTARHQTKSPLTGAWGMLCAHLPPQGPKASFCGGEGHRRVLPAPDAGQRRTATAFGSVTSAPSLQAAAAGGRVGRGTHTVCIPCDRALHTGKVTNRDAHVQSRVTSSPSPALGPGDRSRAVSWGGTERSMGIPQHRDPRTVPQLLAHHTRTLEGQSDTQRPSQPLSQQPADPHQ